MTEAEWLPSTDPHKMLEILPGKASDRNERVDKMDPHRPGGERERA